MGIRIAADAVVGEQPSQATAVAQRNKLDPRQRIFIQFSEESEAPKIVSSIQSLRGRDLSCVGLPNTHLDLGILPLSECQIGLRVSFDTLVLETSP